MFLDLYFIIFSPEIVFIPGGLDINSMKIEKIREKREILF